MTSSLKYPFMELFMGTTFSLENFNPGDVDLHDIAHSLSNICRYGGHCRKFYSVAEHSVILAEWVLEQTGDARLAYQALMHDSTEAYVGDLPRPLKQVMPWFKEAEDKVWEVIVKAFGPKFLCVQMPELIHEIDSRVLVDERAQVMNPSDNSWAIDSLEPLGVIINFWKPEKGYLEFISMERKLRNMI